MSKATKNFDEACTEKDVFEVDTPADLVAALAALGSKRSAALRSYIYHCHVHGRSLAAWRRADSAAPSANTWYGDRHWGNDDFRNCVEMYVSALESTRLKRHLALSALAETVLQSSVVDAAATIVKLAKSGRNEAVRFAAARWILGARATTAETNDVSDWDLSEDDSEGGAVSQATAVINLLEDTAH